MSSKTKEDYEFADTVFVRDVDSRVFQAISYKCLLGIEGVELIGGNILDSLLGRESASERIKGITVDQDQKNHSVNIKIEVNVAYGISIPEKSEEIQSKVAKELAALTGLHVASVHVVFKNLITQQPIEKLLDNKEPEDEEEMEKQAAVEYTDEF
ncbi:MAG: hypothetical protein S4CHLAM37_09590 [Chlamydiia bacterium]|nr:hypothetical protein [Chlamydiia bacterium]